MSIITKSSNNVEKQQGKLLPTLSLNSAIFLVVSSIIGTGIYKKVAPMSNDLQSPSLVLLCWLLAGLISLCGALSNAEIAGMMADSGGEYVYYRRIYGKITAFMFGWSTFAVIKTASISSIAYVFSQSVNNLITLPNLSESVSEMTFLGIFKPFESFGIKILSILLILFLTWMNSKGLKLGEFFSNTITKIVMASVAIIIIAGLFFSNGSFANIHTPATTYVAKSWGNSEFIAAMFSALLAAFWAYEGWNTLGFIGGEIKNPNRNLPLALVTGLLLVMGIYLTINFTYLYVLPIDNIISTFQAKNEIAAIAVIKHFAGAIGGTLLSIVIVITTLGCTNSTIIMPPRIYYAMARDGIFFKKAGEIDPVSNVPTNAIWMQGIWASLLVLSGTFDQLTEMLIFVAFFFYGLTALGVFVLRIKEPNTPRPYKAFGYPIIPAIFILFCLALIIITAVNKPREAGIGIALMLTGLPFYYYWTREKS